jgi:hypothetical protein
MPRTKKSKPEPEPRTDVVVGRGLLERYRRQSEEMADRLEVGQAVQYFDDGWRYGTVETLPDADHQKYGSVRLVHAATGRIWVAGRDIKPLSLDWTGYYAWRRVDPDLEE